MSRGGEASLRAAESQVSHILPPAVVFFIVSCDTHVEAGLEVVLSIEGFGGEWKVLSCICRLCWLVRPGQYYICSLVLVLSYGAESIMYLRDVY